LDEDSDFWIDERNGKFEVNTFVNERNVIGEDHLVKFLMDTFDSRKAAEKFIIKCEEEAEAYEPEPPSRHGDIWYTQQELADDYNTYDYWD
jgi:hypothetical protein